MNLPDQSPHASSTNPTWLWIDREIRPLYPGYFALVMATGIVSNAFFVMDHFLLSDMLLAVNLAAFPLLLMATVWRALRYGRELWADLTDPKLVFSFFTIVAGADVLGFQLYLRGAEATATGLWLFALAVWVVLSYFSFSVLTFVNTKSGVDVVHGGWLIAIVATESLVLLGVHLTPGFGTLVTSSFVLVHVLWGIGIVFYGIFITLFSYRIFFLRVEPADMSPLFWVVMGAAAISTNAGSAIVLIKPDLQFLLAMRPFVEGTILILWAWGTWWIPLLVVFGVWRHIIMRYPLRYHPSYWSVVFPLGMYALATYRLSSASDFSPLVTIPRVMVWVAFSAWIVAGYGLVASLCRSARYPADTRR